MNIYNSSKNNLIASDAKVAKTFLSRSLGLINRKTISDGEALIIKPCCSVHTFFMKFEIDVLFVNSKYQVIALYEDVENNIILPIHLTSAFVIELKSGQISDLNIEKGDLISLEP